MHQRIWVITNTTIQQIQDAHPTEAQAMVKAAIQESRRIISHFEEESCTANTESRPPLRFDYLQVGDQWADTMPAPHGLDNWAQARDAARLPEEHMPYAVISPQGYASVASNAEDKPEIRRVLNHWPDQIVVTQDWHH